MSSIPGLALAGLLGLSAGSLRADAGAEFPGEIGDLAAAPASSSTITLTWTAPADAVSYHIFRCRNANVNPDGDFGSVEVFGGIPMPGPAGHAETCLVGGLAADTQYWFMVAAYDLDGWASFSNAATARTVAPDQIAPSPVQDLAVTFTDAFNNIYLKWTAPGDDGVTGDATTFEIRFSRFPILTDESFDTASSVLGSPTPGHPGTVHTLMISGFLHGFLPDTTYWFAIKTADERPNWSALSNCPAGKTPDSVPPSAVSDLSAYDATSSSITLAWMAPGDNGLSDPASAYDVRYADSPIITEADFAAATEAVGEPPPGSGIEQFKVSGLAPGRTYWFAMKTADERPNWSELSNTVSLTTEIPDLTPPATIVDLAVTASSDEWVALTWTATGDDGSAGMATAYDLRFSTKGAILTDGDFDAATPVDGEPGPTPGLEAMTVTRVSPGVSCWFALKASDEVANWSALSNNAFSGGSGGAISRCGASAPGRIPASWIGLILALALTTALGRRR